MTITITDDMRRTLFDDPPAITDTALIERATQKWKSDPDDPAGPIQVGKFNKCWSRLRSQAQAINTGEGSQMVALMSRDYYSSSALTVMAEIGEAHGWKVSKKAANSICKEIERRFSEAIVADRIPRQETDEEVTRRLEGERRREEMQREREEASRRAVQMTEAILDKRPPAATALIVAEFDVSDTDIMTDYFAHHTERQVAIGWRTGSREDFAQLRRAAAMFDETEHLGPQADDDVEHRDNHSMGGGNFVKRGGQHCTGWRVRSVPINRMGDGFTWGINGNIEDMLPDAPEPSEPGEAVEGEDYRIVQQYHSKRGCDIWTVVPEGERTDRETFTRNKAAAKRLGGWYYRTFGDNEGGFHFKDMASAQAFAENDLETA